MIRRINPLSKNRHIAITIGTEVIALISAIYLVGVPSIPAVAGVGLAVTWLIWRAPTA